MWVHPQFFCKTIIYLMQTVKWGPPGWRLLNSIIFNYPEKPTLCDRKLYLCFFCHVGNVLPCIYCRRSYRQFIDELPVKDWLNNAKDLRYHYYLIHNKVNNK